MNIDSTEPALFFSRTLAHLCAPVFVLLTGLSAYLYGEKYQGQARRVGVPVQARAVSGGAGIHPGQLRLDLPTAAHA